MKANDNETSSSTPIYNELAEKLGNPLPDEK